MFCVVCVRVYVICSYSRVLKEMSILVYTCCFSVFRAETEDVCSYARLRGGPRGDEIGIEIAGRDCHASPLVYVYDSLCVC